MMTPALLVNARAFEVSHAVPHTLTFVIGTALRLNLSYTLLPEYLQKLGYK
jgi:hypothetical protein